MVHTVPYLGVSIGALCCYIFLWFSLSNMKVNQAIVFFRAILTACLLWTGGSVCMRLQLYPGMEFWFHVSIAGMIFIPVTMSYFLFCILEISNRYIQVVYTLGTVLVYIFNVLTEKIVPLPQVIRKLDGMTQYIYSMPRAAYWFGIVEFLVWIGILWMAYCKIRNQKDMKQRITPFLLGASFVVLGNLMMLIPSVVFPYDTFSGIIMACCFAFIVNKQYMFKTSNRIVVGGVHFGAVAFLFLYIYFLQKRVITNLLIKGNRMDEYILITAAVSVLLIMLLHYIIDKIIELIVTRRRQQQFHMLEDFRTRIVTNFDINYLLEETIQMIHELLKSDRIFITLADENGKKIERYHKCLGYGIREACELELKLREQKEEMEGLYSHVGKIYLDGAVCGYIYMELSYKERLDYQEVQYFKQICNYVSTAVKNISSYQAVYKISIHDDLTGLYNRGYISEYFKKHWKNDSVKGIIYFDVDDFKLFNDLYGMEFGDEILVWCAKTISDLIGEEGVVFRIGSNEFIACYENKNVNELFEYAKSVQDYIESDRKGKPKTMQPITFSIGIVCRLCPIDEINQLRTEAERASFFAKKNGKNRIEVYDVSNEYRVEELTRSEHYSQIAPTIYALTAAIDAKDSFTFKHSCNVSDYAVILAREVGLSEDDIQIVKEAGLLHDIGKIGIDESILKKKGKLTKEEYEIMKTHVANSIEMIHYLPNMNYVIPAVVSHHERYDGKGYPRGLKGENIPYHGRILAICDSFDAMVSKRVYKEAMSVDVAIKEIKENAGTQFDPKLAKTFVELIEKGKIVVMS